MKIQTHRQFLEGLAAKLSHDGNAAGPINPKAQAALDKFKAKHAGGDLEAIPILDILGLIMKFLPQAIAMIQAILAAFRPPAP